MGSPHGHRSHDKHLRSVSGGAVSQKVLEKYPSIFGGCTNAGDHKTFKAAVAALGKAANISERIKPIE